MRNLIRKEIKTLLKEWIVDSDLKGYQERRKDQIKKMESFHKKENESYLDYEERMLNMPEYVRGNTQERPGSWNHAVSEYEKAMRDKESLERNKRDEERSQMRKLGQKKYDEHFLQLRKDPYYQEAISLIAGRSDNKTLIQSLMVYLETGRTFQNKTLSSFESPDEPRFLHVTIKYFKGVIENSVSPNDENIFAILNYEISDDSRYEKGYKEINLVFYEDGRMEKNVDNLYVTSSARE